MISHMLVRGLDELRDMRLNIVKTVQLGHGVGHDGQEVEPVQVGGEQIQIQR